MTHSRDATQQCESDIDQQITATAPGTAHGKWGEYDGTNVGTKVSTHDDESIESNVRQSKKS